MLYSMFFVFKPLIQPLGEHLTVVNTQLYRLITVVGLVVTD